MKEKYSIGRFKAAAELLKLEACVEHAYVDIIGVQHMLVARLSESPVDIVVDPEGIFFTRPHFSNERGELMCWGIEDGDAPYVAYHSTLEWDAAAAAALPTIQSALSMTADR